MFNYDLKPPVFQIAIKRFALKFSLNQLEKEQQTLFQ